MPVTADADFDAHPGASPSASKLGPYRLLTRIGEGGMGVVHLAQTSDGRRVALKVLRPHVVGDTEARERLAREVSSLRRVNSPRVAEVLDADPYGQTPYVVTRYVPGLSLYHHVVEEGVLVGRDLLHFADCLAEALQAVHSVGVLHRDVKPTNVLMEGRSPVLIDFGLARVDDDPRLTQTGFLLGTPGYLAPEILYGEDATPASDVHAWAATVTYAATGRPPYGRGPTMGVLDRVRRGQHDLSGVPTQLAALLADALRPEAWERPVLVDIRAWVAQRQVQGQEQRQVPRPAHPETEREQWTRPVHPAPPAAAVAEGTPSTRVVPLHAPSSELAPLTAPVATSAVTPVLPAQLAPSAGQVPSTRVLPLQEPPGARTTGRPTEPRLLQPVQQPGPVAPRRPSRLQQGLQLLGLATLTAGLVAYAPYAGAAMLAVTVLVLRTVSITRERHARRRSTRGRARWYDVPATGLALPVYALGALLGSTAVMLTAAMTGTAMFSLGYLLAQSTEASLLMAGVGVVPALWWGPGAGRVRESTRHLVTRSSGSDLGGWFIALVCLLGAAALVGILFDSGANWVPAISPPWSGLL